MKCVYVCWRRGACMFGQRCLGSDSAAMCGCDDVHGGRRMRVSTYAQLICAVLCPGLAGPRRLCTRLTPLMSAQI